MFSTITDTIEKYKQKFRASQKAMYSQMYQSVNEKTKQKFDDPIAQNTDWFPVKPGGVNFKTQFLSLTPHNQIKVKKTKLALFFYILFAAVGLIFIYVGLKNYIMENNIGGLVITLVFGLPFFLVGAILLLNSRRLLTFDKDTAYAWAGSKQPRDIIKAEDKARLIKFDRIKGIQIIKEYNSSSKGKSKSYYSYEINLILDNNERINVTDHGNLSAVRADAKMLSDYLGVPVFDAS